MMLVGLFGLMSLWFGNSVTVQTNICSQPVAPVIMVPLATATITAGDPVIVSGSAQAGSMVNVSDNNVPDVAVTADESDSFATQIILTSGSHTLGITSTNLCRTLTPGGSVTVIVQPAPVIVQPPSTPPTTSIQPQVSPSAPTNTTQPLSESPSTPTTPAHDSSSGALEITITKPTSLSTNAPSVYLAGQTNQAATETVSVKGQVIAKSDTKQTSFGFLLPLAIGSNTITVTATSETGSVTHSLTITRTVQITWYHTTQGKILIGGASLAAVLIIILIILVLL